MSVKLLLLFLFVAAVYAEDWIKPKVIDSIVKSDSSSLLEEKGFIKFKLNLFGKKKKKPKPKPPPPPPRAKPYIRRKFTGASMFVTEEDTHCVVCQYLVQRTQAELLVQSASSDPAKGSGSTVLLEMMNGWKDDVKASQDREFAKGRFRAKMLSKERKYEPWTQQEWNLMVSENAAAGGGNKQWARADMLQYRPDELRYAPSAPALAQARAEEEMFMNNAMSTHRMPPYFKRACGETLQLFRQVITGLYYKDRPEQICKNIKACLPQSYLSSMPHQIRTRG